MAHGPWYVRTTPKKRLVGDTPKMVKAANLDFLRTASVNTLQEYELSRRNSAANLAAQLKALLHQVVDDLVEADLARLAREVRELSYEPKQSDPYLLDK